MERISERDVAGVASLACPWQISALPFQELWREKPGRVFA